MSSVEYNPSNNYRQSEYKALEAYPLSKSQQKTSCLIHRRATRKECLVAQQFWKQQSLESDMSKHQKKTAAKESKRVQRILRSKKENKSLNKEINEKLYLDSSCKTWVNENTDTSEIASLSPSCALTDDELEYVVDHFRHLESLDLRNCMDLTDKGLKHLQRLHSLEHLFLACNNFLLDKEKITENGLSSLSRLRLKSLKLSGFNFVIDKPLSLYSGLPIEYLFIDKCHITDTGILSLKQLPCLKKIIIHSCHFLTDEGVSFLKNLSLDLLIVQGCYNVSNCLQKKEL